MERLTPTYDDFPSIQWEIGMPEMIEAYERMRSKSCYTEQEALHNASAVYNSTRHHYSWSLIGMPMTGDYRDSYKRKMLATARQQLKEMGVEACSRCRSESGS